MSMSPTTSTSSTSFFQSTWNKLWTEGKQVVADTNALIARADSSLIQPTLCFVQTHWPKVIQTSEKASRLAVNILKIGVACVLFSANTTFFMLGAAAAIVFPEHMRAAINRIIQVWDSLPTRAKFFIFAPLPIAWPSYFVIAAPFVGAYVSLLLQERAGVIHCQKIATPLPPSDVPIPSAPLMTTTADGTP